MTDREEYERNHMTDFLVQRVSRIESYHDHKEKMAHAALLVNLGLVYAVSTTSWPPPWVPALHMPGKAVAFVGIVAPGFSFTSTCAGSSGIDVWRHSTLQPL